jgi:hypothetical protein
LPSLAPRCLRLALAATLLSSTLSGAELAPVADAFVRNGAPNTSHNSNELELAARGIAFSRKVYLAFDLAQAIPSGSRFSEASLQFRFSTSGSPLIGTATGPVTVRLYAIADNEDGWVEGEITWNNAPKNLANSNSGFIADGVVLLAESTLNSASVDPAAGLTFASAELTEFLNWAIGLRGNRYGTGLVGDPDARITLMLSSTGEVGDPGFRLASRETGTTSSPKLRYSIEAGPPAEAQLENARYRVQLREDHGFEVLEIATGATATFYPRFSAIRQTANPGYTLDPITGALQSDSSTTNVNFRAPAWGGKSDWHAAPGNRTELVPIGVSSSASEFLWTYAAASDFSFSARLRLPDDGEPQMEWTLTPGAARYFSVSYLGAPSISTAEVAEFYQPGIWDGRRFPDKAYLIDESRCSLPLAWYRKGEQIVGVLADPQEMPFRLPTTSNSRFGLTITGVGGAMQPIIAAPLYGTAESNRSAPHTFRVRLIVRQDSGFGTFRHLAETLYGFEDRRRNLPGGSLNAALDNLTDLILNRSGENYSHWIPNAKANDYINDQPGYARFQSAVYALSLAMTRDDAELFEERAVPSIEYFASRRRNLFKISAYDPDYPMGGPMNGMRIGEWITLSAMTGRRSPAFELLGREALFSSFALENKINHTVVYPRAQALDLAKLWLRHLTSYYRATGEIRYLEDAVAIADQFIAWRLNQPPLDFRDTHSSFWAEISPIWEAFFELYEVTGQSRYRDAAIQALQPFIMRMNFSPAVPAGEVTVSGETVPAWRVSEVGLISEAAGTSSSHRGIFMPYAAAFLARAARYTGDRFYADLAKANIIGRFLNYPGYAYRNQHSTVFQRADYPLRPYSEYENTGHMNHPLPLACMVIDYLVADAERRSDGAIWFPSLFTDSGAYFKNRVYGHAPGRFYGDTQVWPWLPRGLVSLSGPNAEQLNYLAGIGNGRLYLSLSNQSPEAVTAILQFDKTRVALTDGGQVRAWSNGAVHQVGSIHGGGLTITVPPDGLLALAIDGATPALALQPDYANAHGPRLPAASYFNGTAPFGRNVGMILSLSPLRQWAFVYTDAPPSVMISATLNYRIDTGAWQTATKSSYPFEFSVPLPPTAATFSYFITGSSGQSSTLETLSLATAPPPASPVISLADASSASAIQLAWMPVPGATAYRLERYGPEAPGFVTLPNLTGSATGFVDTGLSGNTAYLYRLRAVNDYGESLWTADLSIRTDSPLETWRRFHFGYRENAGDAGDAANPDGDGFPNLIEYALGTSPTETTPPLRMVGRALALPLPAGRPDVSLAAQYSTDLTAWADAALAVGGDFNPVDPDFKLEATSNSTIDLLLVPPQSADRIFFRLEARP